MVEILKSNIKNFLDIYFETNENYNIDQVDEMYMLGIVAGASVTDFYTVARIMKSDQYNKCIIYGGLAHYSIIKLYLESVGFECINEISSTESEFRCVKDVQDFNSFFD